MTENGSKFDLPSNIDSYLATLCRKYDIEDQPLLRELVVNSAVYVHKEWDYDNWNGVYCHAVTLSVPEDLYSRIKAQREALEKRLAIDLNIQDNSQDECVSKVFIEMKTVHTDNWREESGIYRPHTSTPPVSPEVLHRIWGDEHVRVFLSHKATVKENTWNVKQSLDRCGITAFVAHDDIEPTEEWQKEIERALFSMDALVALLSEDFHDSNWTDQEVGVAIGRGVPVIPVRLGMDPYGLMGKLQGLGGCDWSDPGGIAIKVFQLLYKKLPDKSRLFECALSAYRNSSSSSDSAWKVKHVLSVFDSLSTDQVYSIINANRENSQNAESFQGRELLLRLLEKWTGEKWIDKNGELQQLTPLDNLEIPF